MILCISLSANSCALHSDQLASWMPPGRCPPVAEAAAAAAEAAPLAAEAAAAAADEPPPPDEAAPDAALPPPSPSPSPPPPPDDEAADALLLLVGAGVGGFNEFCRRHKPPDPESCLVERSGSSVRERHMCTKLPIQNEKDCIGRRHEPTRMDLQD